MKQNQGQLCKIHYDFINGESKTKRPCDDCFRGSREDSQGIEARFADKHEVDILGPGMSWN